MKTIINFSIICRFKKALHLSPHLWKRWKTRRPSPKSSQQMWLTTIKEILPSHHKQWSTWLTIKLLLIHFKGKLMRSWPHSSSNPLIIFLPLYLVHATLKKVSITWTIIILNIDELCITLLVLIIEFALCRVLVLAAKY